MDEVWIVFLAGSVLSFSLMMYVYFRIFLKRGTKPKLSRPEAQLAPANRRFLDFLRAEAMARVNDNIASVMAQQGKVAPERGAAAQLVESRQTLQSLFSGEVVAAYDKVVAALDGKSAAGGDARKLFAEFKAKMKGYLESHGAIAA